MMGLTHMQARTLDVVRTFAEDGKSPSYDEIAEALDLASKSQVKYLLDQLEARGRIRRLPHRARSIELVDQVDDLERRPSAELRAMRARIDAILKARAQ
jgi:repressor LexA